MVATDLSVKQMSDLICMVEKSGSEAVYEEITDGIISTDNDGHQVADVEQVKTLLELVSLR